MLKQLRQDIIQSLWITYSNNNPQVAEITHALAQRNIQIPPLDHFAIIDLPGPHSGIDHLKHIFSSLGYIERGRDYLADKQNDFLWLAEEDSTTQIAPTVLPQVVVADFRLEELPPEVKKIIEKSASYSNPIPYHDLGSWIERVQANDKSATESVKAFCLNYLKGREWPLPNLYDFKTVHEFNELLAWVLLFGRKPNHFTFSIHLLDQFATLAEFNQFLNQHTRLTLNQDGGLIKGGPHTGIAQSSTVGTQAEVTLEDGAINIPHEFVEFVWRYPTSAHKPIYWNDYYTGFIAKHADHVIESLYTRTA